MLRRKPKIRDPLLTDTPEAKGQNQFQIAIKWMRSNPKKSIPLIVVTLLAIGLLIWLVWPKQTNTATVPKPKEEPPKPQVFYSPLTGKKVTETQSKLPVIAVMIENSPEARPQSGLKQAGVVFESVAEGGITRFLALYQEDKPSRIGPVRSVRPQFASWAAAFDAGVAHVGGSDIPLRKLRSGKIKDLDQFFNAGSYYRTNDRYAPHNMYTSYSRLSKLAKSKGYTSSKFTSWPREKEGEEDESSTPTETSQKSKSATNISVPVSTGNFAVSYKWNKKNERYTRYLAGTAHKDQEKGTITADVVVALQVPHDVIRDSNGYSYPDVNKSGKGWVFQDGTVTQVSWKKSSDNAQLQLLDSQKQPLILKPGRTWISAIRPDRTPTW